MKHSDHSAFSGGWLCELLIRAVTKKFLIPLDESVSYIGFDAIIIHGGVETKGQIINAKEKREPTTKVSLHDCDIIKTCTLIMTPNTHFDLHKNYGNHNYLYNI